jgi:hypothetical protein
MDAIWRITKQRCCKAPLFLIPTMLYALTGTVLMKHLSVLSLIVLLAACAVSEKHPIILPEGLADIATTSPIACQFEKQSANNPKNSTWYFWREELRTETRDEVSNQGEIWERNNAGHFFYTRLFYNERIALEFVPGDLAATDVAPSWRLLSSLVDPSTLGKELPLMGKDIIGSNTVEHYSGNLNGIITEIDWLPSLQLPTRLVKKLPEGTITLTLTKCSKELDTSVKPITKAELDNLRHLDYTDLGDMEDDPMVRHLEQLMGELHHN